MTDNGTDVFIFDDDVITINLSGDCDTNEDTITLTGWDNPLSTSLTNGLTYSNYPATTISAAGGGGATLSTTNVGGLMWNNNTTYSNTVNTTWTNGYNQPQVLRVAGNAEFEGEVSIRGVKLDERLTAIEERLGILRPNNDLEGKWEKLKALGEEYRKLEQEILEGESIWDMLKK
jgi:hypothetical protein